MGGRPPVGGAALSLIVRDLDNEAMLHIMADENMQGWASTSAVIVETVRAVRDYLAVSGPAAKLGHGAKANNAEAITAFLGWPEGRVERAVAILNAEEAGTLTPEDTADLSIDRPRSCVARWLLRTATRWQPRNVKTSDLLTQLGKVSSSTRLISAFHYGHPVPESRATYDPASRSITWRVAETNIHLRRDIGSHRAVYQGAHHVTSGRMSAPNRADGVEDVGHQVGQRVTGCRARELITCLVHVTTMRPPR